MDHPELLKRQYLQLLEVDQLSLPPKDLIRLPGIQAKIYETMFQRDCLQYSPPDRYKLRVLKRLVQRMEDAITDPEEDEISDDLTACLAELMSRSQVPAHVSAQQKHFVTYTVPDVCFNAPTVTTREARALIAASGTTGLRTWEAALHLGSYLSSAEGCSLIKGKNILELGAGTGFVSILCAKHLGAKYVLATDGSGEVIDDLSSNMFLNQLEGSGISNTSVLEWGHALIEETLNRPIGDHGYDLILGSDLTYNRSSILPLVCTLRDLFINYPGVQAIISATVRNQETLKLFEEACRSWEFIINPIHFPNKPEEIQIGLFHPTAVPIKLYKITR